MKKLIMGLCCAAALAFAGCQKSVESEAQDVREAQKDKMENVNEELRDAQDAAVEGEKKVIEEKRELEDAKVRDGVAPPPTVP